jgi:WASH complex subunit strumpellin
LDYDPNFGTLIRKKSKIPLDGIPLAIGLACLLKQFHPSYTKQLLAYLGQFIRSSIQEMFQDVDAKAQEIPRDILNTLVFMEQLCNYSSIPRKLIYSYVPSYIFDALKFNQAAKK